jgi:ribosomal protein S18 acetylase RimI-like enzyme
VWNALETVHAHFAVGRGAARRYPGEVVPFGALADTSQSAVAELEALLVPNDLVYVFGNQPEAANGLKVGPPLHCHQMLGPLHPAENLRTDETADMNPVLLSSEDASAMVALTTLAFPGFFRQRTCEMGTYYGIRVDGELVAMAGERLAIPGFREISAVCTHPAHTGKGYATKLMICLMREHANAGLRSFLHVSKKNIRAAALYERLGFRVARSVSLWPVSLAG